MRIILLILNLIFLIISILIHIVHSDNQDKSNVIALAFSLVGFSMLLSSNIKSKKLRYIMIFTNLLVIAFSFLRFIKIIVI